LSTICDQPHHSVPQDCLPTKAKQGWGWYLDGRSPGKTRLLPVIVMRPTGSGGGSTESQYLSKSTNIQINIYFRKSRSNTM